MMNKQGYPKKMRLCKCILYKWSTKDRINYGTCSLKANSYLKNMLKRQCDD